MSIGVSGGKAVAKSPLTPATKSETDPLESPEAMKAFLERASEGDEGTRSKIREMMSCESDELVRIFGGDVAWTAEKAGVRTAAGKNVAIQEAMHRKLADLRAALAGPSPTPVEMVLA